MSTISRFANYDDTIGSPTGGVSKVVGLLIIIGAHGVQAASVFYNEDRFIAHFLEKHELHSLGKELISALGDYLGDIGRREGM